MITHSILVSAIFVSIEIATAAAGTESTSFGSAAVKHHSHQATAADTTLNSDPHRLTGTVFKMNHMH